MPPPLTVGLVSCASTKGSEPAAARRLYASDLFRKASAYAERAYDLWFILSAKHGLLHPDQVIESYDLTLKGMSRAEQQAWAHGVLVTLDHLEIRDATFFLHAGVEYRRFLEPFLHCDVPLRGLGIGKQLSWYRIRLHSGPTPRPLNVPA